MSERILIMPVSSCGTLKKPPFDLPEMVRMKMTQDFSSHIYSIYKSLIRRGREGRDLVIREPIENVVWHKDVGCENRHNKDYDITPHQVDVLDTSIAVTVNGIYFMGKTHITKSPVCTNIVPVDLVGGCLRIAPAYFANYHYKRCTPATKKGKPS